jgi:RNA-directed DNA polymerase
MEFRRAFTMEFTVPLTDGLVHGKSEKQIKELLTTLTQRFKQCGLELHPEKTKIVYCKDDNRKGKYPNKEFTFLGYTFRTRSVKNSKTNKTFASFAPAASEQAMKSMRARIRGEGVRNRTDLELKDIAEKYNPVIRGWIEYYGCYNRSSLYVVCRHFNKTLVSWIMRKYKKFRGHKTQATQLLDRIFKAEPGLFAHWKIGMRGLFA